MRDQASKTFDIYVQRIRKYGETLQDTALRSGTAGGNSTANAGPRMGTVQNDQSWAGWAISSFTNKISLARGEMQASAQTNGSAAGSDVARLISASPVLDGRPSHLTQSTVPKWGSASANQSTSAAIDDDDETSPIASFDEGDMDAWGALGDMNDDDDDDDDDKITSKASLGVNEPSAGSTIKPTMSSSTTMVKSADKSLVAYDDSGEPDFAGWLAAQSQQSKAKGKKPLPKGLTKKQPSLSATVSVNRASAATVTSTAPTIHTRNPKIAAKGSTIIATHPSTSSSGPSTSRVLLSAVDDHDDHGQDLKGAANPWEEDSTTIRPPGGGPKIVTRTGGTEDRSSAAAGIKVNEIKPKENVWAEDLDDGWGDGWD